MKSHSSFFIFFLIFICCQGQCQETNLLVNGIVLDSKTKIPLAYASISIAGKSIGTLTNSEGEFEFTVPGSFYSDSLKISHIGYKTFSKKVSDISDMQTIYLDESPLMLGAVTIRGTQQTAKEVLEKSQSMIQAVYPSEPYMMEAFFRSWEKIDFTDSITYPGTLLEAAAVIYDPGYTSEKVKRKNEKIYIREIRRSKLMPGWNYNHNGISYVPRENDVRYNHLASFRMLKGFFDFPNQLVYTFEEPTEIDGEDLYVIKVDVPNSLNLSVFYKVYISMDDYAILRFELTGDKKEIDYSKEWHTDQVFHLFIFRRYNDVPYLSYGSIDYTIRKLDQVNKRVKQTEQYHWSVLINDVVTDDLKNKLKTLGPEISGKALETYQKTYNENFWKDYNIVIENPMDREIVSWFEQHEKLEAQFKKANNKAKNKFSNDR